MSPTEQTAAPGFLNVHEVAQILRVCPHTVYAMAKRGELESQRVGRLHRWRRVDVERLVLGTSGGTQ